MNIRGLAAPGSKVTVNGKVLLAQNVTAQGCFIEVRLITAKEPELVIAAELNGKSRVVKRAFRVVD